MSLDFNGWGAWEGTKEDFFDENDRMRPEVESVIFHTMFVGIGQITDATVREFWNRSVLLSAVCYQERPFFSEDLLRKMVGLNKRVLAGFWDGRV